MICQVCGLLVGDGNRHIAWHVRLGDIGITAWTCAYGDCPIDGAPIGNGLTGPRGGEAWWTCGHHYAWTEPDATNQADRTADEGEGVAG